MEKGMMLAVFVSGACLAGEGYRTFTAEDGRTLEAKVVAYDPVAGKVQIERADRARLTVPGTAFSAEDQAYLRHWAAAQTFAAPSRFKLDLRRNELESTKREINADLTHVEGGGRGGGREDGVQTVAIDKTTRYAYELVLANGGDVPLENLTMEFRIHYDQEKAVADEKDVRAKDDPRPQRHLAVSESKVAEGRARIGTVEAKESKSVSTGGVELLTRSAVRRFGDKIDLKANLAGAWVKVSMKDPDGGTLVRDIALPPGIMKRHPWNPEEGAQ